MGKAVKHLAIAEIPEWIADNYGIKQPTRQTIYNYIKIGKKGVKLRSAQKFGVLYVTERWLHDFCSQLDSR